MENLERARLMYLVRVVLILGLNTFLGATSMRAAEKVEYRALGTFVEGCSCTVPCTCDISGAKHGCQGVGAMVFTSGTYKDVDLAGAKVAHATAPGNWIRFYLQAKNAQQEEALNEFAKAAFREFGKAEAFKKASIDLSGQGRPIYPKRRWRQDHRAQHRTRARGGQENPDFVYQRFQPVESDAHAGQNRQGQLPGW